MSHSECRIGFGLERHEIDRVIVDLHHLDVGREPRLESEAGACARGRREHHVVGGEVLAVVELDALAQIETPARRLDHLPALGEAGNDLEILVALGQPLVHVAEHAMGEGLVQRVGIERLEVALEGETESRGRRGLYQTPPRARRSRAKVLKLHLVPVVRPAWPGRIYELSVLAEPVEQDLVVGALRELHLLRHAPGQRLLVQRDVGPRPAPARSCRPPRSSGRACPCRTRPGSCPSAPRPSDCSSRRD